MYNYHNVYDAIVVGSGAAGYNAACRLKQAQKNVLLVTEGINCGTSRNTGSDKQTYYKLGLGGDSLDSVRQMAEDLFAGGSVDGDTALCEAALSARCFLNLCEKGVPFPQNRYGEYIGYKTDHDPFARATSAGPLTSKFMTEALGQEADRLGVEVLDGHLVVEILKNESGVCGVLTLEIATGKLQTIQSGNVILAVGGPAGIYADSVYPVGHTGATSLALEAGAALQNMTEWQYGLASTNPRWNVSGSYMQVLPRLVSIDEAGNEREFLADYFTDPGNALSALFLKGYQWPFDSHKVLTGSSVIDLLVYRETVKYGRKVYLDYTKNPFGYKTVPFDILSEEAYAYLKKADILFGTPIERLKKLNQPAIDLYASKGVDLTKELLEIALCAQHCNGGIAVDAWWQTEVPGLFACGECAGTHGITRPGGSALNAGQVGSLRAAQYIVAHPRTSAGFEEASKEALSRHEAFCSAVLSDVGNAEAKLFAARRRMSHCGAAIRDIGIMKKAKAEIEKELRALSDIKAQQLPTAYKLKDALITQNAVLAAILDFVETYGVTRGSALCYDKKGVLRENLDEAFRFSPEEGQTRNKVQELRLADGKIRTAWRPVRPLPREEDAFEAVWRQYRKNQNIY